MTMTSMTAASSAVTPAESRRVPLVGDEPAVRAWGEQLVEQARTQGGELTGDIKAHLAEIYDTDISRDTTSGITDAVLQDMVAWQNRPLDRIYPVILIDAIVVKIRDGHVATRPVYVAMGINLDSERDVLGLWVGPGGGEGAKFWMTVLTELRNRGVHDTFIVCCDGLKALPESIRATWPLAEAQLCVVHLVRS